MIVSTQLYGTYLIGSIGGGNGNRRVLRRVRLRLRSRCRGIDRFRLGGIDGVHPV